MKRKMHAKTVALVLATTTTLQVTGLASKLVNGEAFIKANAAEGGSASAAPATTTTSASVTVSGPGISTTTSGQVFATVPTSVASEDDLLDELELTLNVTTSGGAFVATTSAAVTWSGVVNNKVIGTVSGQLAFEKDGECYIVQSGYDFKFDVTVDGNQGGDNNGGNQGGDDNGGSQGGDNNGGSQGGDNEQVVMPKTVIIKGTERVGKTLTAQLIKEDASTGKTSNFTTSAGVTYAWYRLDNTKDDISEGKKVGKDDDEYKLTGSDKGKYIKLVVTYNGKSFEDITSKIAKKASSGGSSSSSSDDDDDDNDNGSSNDNNNGNNGNNNSNGNAATSTASIETNADGTVKLVDKNGQAATGWQLVNGTWYLGDATGTPLTGWQLVNGTWYLMDTTGVMQTGWQLVGGKWYLLNNSGSMATGWQSVNGKWYLLNGDGSMATGWQKSNGKWYYLYSDGSMASNTVIDGYTVDASGAWV